MQRFACFIFELNLNQTAVAIASASSDFVDFGPPVMDPCTVFDQQLLQRMSDRMIRDAVQDLEHETRDRTGTSS